MKIFELNKNLFKVGDNYVCTSNEEIKENECYISWEEDCNTPQWILYFKVTELNGKYPKKVIFSTQFIDESIPVLDIENKEDIESIEVEYKETKLPEFKNCEYYKEVGCIKDICTCYKMVVVTLLNGKIKCKVQYKN